MKKILVYLMTFVIVFVSTLSFSMRYSKVYAETGQYGLDKDDALYDEKVLLYDTMYNAMYLTQSIIDLKDLDLVSSYENFNIYVNSYYDYENYSAFVQDTVDNDILVGTDGEVTISSDLLEQFKEFAQYLIDNGYVEEVNPDDYYTRYVTDTSSTRVPATNVSYNYFMDYTGEEGEAVIDELTGRNYYWINWGGSSLTTSSSGSVSGARFAYVPEEYEDSVVFIQYSDSGFYQPYIYNSAYMTFSAVPYHLINWEVNSNNNATGYCWLYNDTFGFTDKSQIEVNTFYSADVYATTSHLISSVNVCVDRSMIESFFRTDYTDCTYYGYYGTTNFVIWKSQEAYIEWMTMYPNFDQTQQVIYNEDNSVTITNVYNTTNNYYGDDSGSSDYSDILTQIDEHIVSGFEDVVDALGGGSGGYSDTLDDIVDQLKKINNKLLYSNILDTIESVLDWVDELGDDATGVALETLEQTVETAFPFSIVTDLVLVTGLFVADPVVPQFILPVDLTGINSNWYYEINVDLSQFQLLADILRAFMLLFWIVGLIKLTPRFLSFGGGFE